MNFELSINIRRPPEICFAFLRDKDTFPQKSNSPVLVLDKITSGPVGPGTRYREVVQMLPLVRGEIRSVVTRFEPPTWLEEDFEGVGMVGYLSYQFIPKNDDTLLIQREQIQMSGLFRFIEPLIQRMLFPRLQHRLQEIKEVLEGGWEGN